MSKQPSSGAAGSVRARLRLVGVLLLGLLTLLYVVLAVRLYFVPAGDAVVSALLGVALAVVAVVYAVLTRAVLKQSRVGHLIAIAVCGLGAVLAISADMAWLDWAVLVVNVAGLAVLLGCVPRKPSA